MTAIHVADNLAAIRERIAAACIQTGRGEDAVRLVAVTKRIALPLVVEACRWGQLDLAENRLPDAVDRQRELAAALQDAGLDPGPVRWHFIGHIQSRKAPQAVGNFTLLHGVDSLKLAGKLSDRAADLPAGQPVLLEVNITGEQQKHGLRPQEVAEVARRCSRLPGLRVDGLMCMARYGAGEQDLHETFAGLRRLAEAVRTELGLPLPELSMGMSDDFEAAIAEGATMVRVGSAIFGPRM